MKVMISQPIEGRNEQEIENTYKRACKKLEAQGHQIIYNYAIDKEDLYETLKEYYGTVILNPELRLLVDSLDSMSVSEAVYFCKDWEKSRHCRLEHKSAQEYGLKIIYE